ncbi:hypothetical protein V6Z11_A08G140200 [Gossypium hirsutum]
MFQIGLTLALIYQCRCHVLDRSYTDTQQADAMSQTGLALACISRGLCISQTCLTLALVSMLMHVPNMSYIGLYISRPMHVPDMSYTGSGNVADTCPKHVLH